MASRRKAAQLTEPVRARSRGRKPGTKIAPSGYPANEQQQKFAVEYVKCMNAEDAAIAAGYSPSFAHTKAFNLPKTLYRYIQELQNKVVDESPIVPDTVIREFAPIAFANEDDYHEVYEKDLGKGVKVMRIRGKPWNSLSRTRKSAIREVYYDEHGEIRYRLHGKSHALTAIGKFLGMFNDKLIIERRNVDVKARFDFTNVPTEKLLMLEEQLRSLESGVTIEQTPT